MLTIFTTPKAFKGRFADIQENAILSWSKLSPKCEIILLGDEDGVREIAGKYGLRHIPRIKLSKEGTPIVSDLFSQAERAAKYPLLAYINSDLIMLSECLPKISEISSKKFLIIGQRWDFDTKKENIFRGNWKKDFTKKVQKEGNIRSIKAVDYFIFPRGLDLEIPPFIIGRSVWDNWFLYQAKKKNIPLVDASSVITAVHQNHDYSHAGGLEKILSGSERQINILLDPDRSHAFDLANVDLILTPRGLIKPRHSIYRTWKALRVFPILHPRAGLLLNPPILFLQYIIDHFRIFEKKKFNR